MQVYVCLKQKTAQWESVSQLAWLYVEKVIKLRRE